MALETEASAADARAQALLRRSASQTRRRSPSRARTRSHSRCSHSPSRTRSHSPSRTRSLSPPKQRHAPLFPPPKATLALLTSHADVPAWYQHTPHILSGYRRIGHSAELCVASLWYLHNESVNFYSHAAGAVAFAALLLVSALCVLRPAAAVWADYLVFAVFHVSAVVCLTNSAVFHLFCCHSQHVQRTCMKCDYVGIVVLIVGSLLCSLYYGLYCHNILQPFYMLMVSAAGIVTMFVNTSEYFAGPKYRLMRTLLFISIGFLGLIPVIHGVIAFEEDISTLSRSIGAPYIAMEGLSYLSGATLFIFHFPECVRPGRFDYWFQSHQIFHVAVLFGAWFHYVSLVEAFKWRAGVGECAQI